MKSYFYKSDKFLIDIKFPDQAKILYLDVASMYKPPKVESGNLLSEIKDTGSVILLSWDFSKGQQSQTQFDDHAILYSNHSYTFLYQYIDSGIRNATIIYSWHGRDSRPTDQGAAALHIMELEKTAKITNHVRVTQSKEPKHFHQMLNNTCIIRKVVFKLNTY